MYFRLLLIWYLEELGAERMIARNHLFFYYYSVWMVPESRSELDHSLQ